LVETDGSIYEGHWMNNEKSGKGRFIDPDGEFYLGIWESNKKNGFGVGT
jgi:hypothetical protein